MEAIYEPSALTKDEPNPLYEALPIFRPQGIQTVPGTKTYFFDPAWRNESFTDRIIRLTAIQLDFFLERDRDIELRYAVQQALAARYTRMQPMDSRFYIPGAARLPNMAAKNVGIFGYNSSGKSTSLRDLLRRYPAYIRHNEYKGIPLEARVSIPILYLVCPESGGSLALYQAILSRIQMLVGTPYQRRMSITEAEATVGKATQTCGVGSIAIDEISNVLKHGAYKDRILGGLTRLNEEFGIPLILVGDQTSRQIFDRFFHAGRRASGLRPWNKMPLDQVYHKWGEGVFQFCIVAQPWKYTEELGRFLHSYSDGLPGPFISAFLMAQQVALEHKRDHVTSQDLHEAVRFRLDQETQGLALIKKERALKAEVRRLEKLRTLKKTVANTQPNDPSVDLEAVVALPKVPTF